MTPKALYAYANSSERTYQRFGSLLPTIAGLISAFHIGHSILNLTTGVSEPLALRLLAIAMITPYAAVHIVDVLGRSIVVKRTFLLALITSGPAFLFGAWLFELSQTNPNLITLIRSQYEFTGALGLILLSSTNPKVAAATTLTTCAALFITMQHFLTFHFEILELSWVTMISSYLIAILAVVIVIRRRAEESKHKFEAVSAIGSSIAHELRTPLLSIKTAAESITGHVGNIDLSDTRDSSETKPSAKNLAPTSQQTRKAINLICEESRSALTLIEIFLVNSNPHGTAGCPQTTESFNVSVAITEALERYPYRSTRERESVNLSVQDDFILNGNKILLIHVIFNLLKNAFDHAKDDSFSIQITSQKSGCYNILIIADNGAGVPDAKVSKIFDPFVSDSKGLGTGIGLSFCKQVIVGTFGGQIACDSVEEQLTKFTISIPRSLE